MASKEIISRIKLQLNEGYIDMNDTYDNDEMNYIRKAIYDLEHYKKALDSACQIIAKCKCFKGCPFEEDCNNVDCFDENVWKEHFMEESEIK